MNGVKIIKCQIKALDAVQAEQQNLIWLIAENLFKYKIKLAVWAGFTKILSNSLFGYEYFNTKLYTIKITRNILNHTVAEQLF